jgi:selenium donor protein
MPNENQEQKVKLTHFSHGLGCGCKMRPQFLEQILAGLPVPTDPALLVGTGSKDDAAVYKINDEQAIVQTVDFFTPIVDDPYDFGAIAATNAISDIYAMGGKPLFALNIVAFPSKKLSAAILEQILKGASDKAAEAGIAIVGGHSIDDEEPKFGMTVTGIIHPGNVLTNNHALPGDVLILTKPIGTGIISTAIRKEIADEDAMKEAIGWMKTLNRAAAETLADFPVSTCTDVTGFGLMGHLTEISRGSGVDVEIFFSKVPFMGKIAAYAEAGAVSGGTRGNYEYYSTWIEWDELLNQIERYMLSDAQTSGGLLIAIPEAYSAKLLETLHARGVASAAVIGSFTSRGPGQVVVRK